MKKSEKKFLNLPEYPGGKEALNKYIKENLKYPKQALEKRIEGTVYLTAEIEGNGNVHNVLVENGLGAGCDEEAIRLLSSIQFGGVKNRGVRVKTKKSFRVNFKLPPEKKLNYDIIQDKKDAIQKKKIAKYSYTINLNRNKS